MSIWSDYAVETKVVDVLESVHLMNNYHHFGRPYISAYQLAIAMDARYPEVAQALNVRIGGAGTGERDSLSQYLARELSHRIKADPGYPVQGAFMSNENVYELSYNTARGERVTSSLTGTGFDLSVFRLRPTG